MKEKYNAPQLQKLESANSNIDGNSLIEKLKQQSEDNKDRNEKIIRQKTLQNDLVSNVADSRNYIRQLKISLASYLTNHSYAYSIRRGQASDLLIGRLLS